MALGGISAALSLALMLVTLLIPSLTYTMPAFAGAVLIVMVDEVDNKWAWVTYVSVGLLSLLLLTDKEAAVMYIVFFGYYPILKPLIERKIRLRPAAILLKFAVFNAAVIGTYWILIKLFGMEIDEIKEYGEWIIWALIAAGNVIFILYDLLLKRVNDIYVHKWQKRFEKMLKR